MRKTWAESYRVVETFLTVDEVIVLDRLRGVSHAT